MARLTPQQRIIRAAKEHRGLRLSADDVTWLARDQAIIDCARSDDEASNEEQAHG